MDWPNLVVVRIVPIVNGEAWKFAHSHRHMRNIIAYIVCAQDCSHNEWNCTHIECTVSSLPEGASVAVFVHSRLWVNTLIDGVHFDARIASVANARVERVQNAKDLKVPSIVAAVSDVHPGATHIP